MTRTARDAASRGSLLPVGMVTGIGSHAREERCGKRRRRWGGGIPSTLLSGLRSLLQTNKSVRYGWSSGWGRVKLSRTADSQTNVELSVGDGGGVTFR